MDRKIRILILEDVETDAELMQYNLRKAGLNFESIIVKDRENFILELQRFMPDLILSDYSLGVFNGTEALAITRKSDADIPFIFVSGAIGEERAIETLTNGATDYVLKDNLARLAPAVHRALREYKNRRQRRLAEEQIRADQAKLRSLTAELQMLEEKQRREFAVELHDSLSQVLAFTKIELGVLQEKIPAELGDSVSHLRNLIDQVISRTRKLTFDLSPATLYSLGLDTALEELAELYTDEGIFNCTFEKGTSNPDLPEQQKILLYRAIRELLVNAAKYANARNARIKWEITGRYVQLTVEDDGVGFDVSELLGRANTEKGFGLFSIRHRISHLGGSMDIISEPGRGTTVVLRVPTSGSPDNKDDAKEQRDGNENNTC